ncbi:MAG: hypothetical protein WC139_00045 [Candidatus Kapaibacterium sp.]
MDLFNDYLYFIKTKQENKMEVKIENGKLFIEIGLQEQTPSASGKTLEVATTHGNVVTEGVAFAVC